MQHLLESQLLAAAFLFESGRSNPAPFEVAEIREAGLANEAPADVERILRESLDRMAGLPESYRVGAFFALGKRHAPDLVPFLRRHLAVEIGRSPEVVYQILIALENSGESVWIASAGTRSSAELFGNVELAREYLSGCPDTPI